MEARGNEPTRAEILREARAIERHRIAFERMGAKFGRLRPGMSKARVRAIVGRPDRVAVGRVGGRHVECWRYLQLPVTDPAERFARFFRLCFRGGRWTLMPVLLRSGNEAAARFLLGPPDATSERKIGGRRALCWRWDYRIAAEDVCFRGGRVVYERSFA